MQQAFASVPRLIYADGGSWPVRGSAHEVLPLDRFAGAVTTDQRNTVGGAMQRT